MIIRSNAQIVKRFFILSDFCFTFRWQLELHAISPPFDYYVQFCEFHEISNKSL